MFLDLSRFFCIFLDNSGRNENKLKVGLVNLRSVMNSHAKYFEGFPLAIQQDKAKGRHVVSTRNIRRGEIVFEALPYAIAIKHVQSTCAHCLKHLGQNEASQLASGKCMKKKL